MRINKTHIALLALPALAQAVSLADFVPRVTDVSGGCRKVYQQAVPDCSPTDFTQKTCSESCVRGLQSMTKSVKDACGSEGLQDRGGESNILKLFLADQGPQGLCENANEVLSKSPPATSSEEAKTEAQTTTSSTPSTTESPTVAESTSTASLTDVPTSILMDTSSSPEPTTSTTAESSPTSEAASTTTQSSQIFEAPSMPPSLTATGASSEETEASGHSGGGSPFDAAGNEFSGASATTSSALTLVLGAAVAAFLAQW